MMWSKANVGIQKVSWEQSAQLLDLDFVARLLRPTGIVRGVKVGLEGSSNRLNQEEADDRWHRGA